jgi:hypothetical protein
MPPIMDVVGFLVSKDAFAVVGGFCFLVAYLAPKTSLATKYLKTDRQRAYLSVAVAVLPGIGLALTHHVATGTDPDVATIIQLSLMGIFAGLNPTKAKPDESPSVTSEPLPEVLKKPPPAGE